MSDEYIDSHFEEIKSHSSDIESRLDDSYCTAEQLKEVITRSWMVTDL